MKVYCNKCKHREFREAAMGCCGNFCKVTFVHEDSAECLVKRLMDCEDVNKNNDCKKFEPNFLTSLSAKFKRSKSVKPVDNRFEIMDL